MKLNLPLISKIFPSVLKYRLRKQGQVACMKIQVRFVSDDESQDVNSSSKDKKKESALKKLESLLDSVKVDGIKKYETESKLNLDLAKPAVRRRRKDESDESNVPRQIYKEIERPIIQAVQDVAASIDDDKTQDELLQVLRDQKKETDEAKARGNQLMEMFQDMKIDRAPKKDSSKLPKMEARSSDFEMFQDSQRRSSFRHQQFPIKSRLDKRIDLYGEEPLGIFSEADTSVNSELAKDDKVWDILRKRELSLSVTHPPRNPFEEMIMWTNQKKIWPFPIDNEYAMTVEQDVGFQEHVFVERELEQGFPKKGAIRAFMELVCNGLSKNPYITLERKKEHIEWYRKYFKSKEDLLRAVNVEVASN